MKSLFNEVYDYTEQLDSKIGKRVFNALDTESIADIILDETGVGYTGTFWFEHYTYHNRVAQSVYDWIINYLNKQGYKYIYYKEDAKS